MAQPAGLVSDARFLLAILSGMMLYLALATGGFAVLGFMRILPDMTQHFHWLAITACASTFASLLSAVLAKRKTKPSPVRNPKA